MNEKPEALVIADELGALMLADELGVPYQCDFHAVCEKAAAKLRSQHAEIERLREALKLALNSHGRMLMSDPPQDAWKFYRVNEVINAALRREEAKP